MPKGPKGQKRPADVISNAVHVMRIATGEIAETLTDDGKNADRRWPPGLEREPPLGAHLTTSRRGYTHHGLYVGDGRVVHYSGLSGFWQCGPVEEVSLAGFSAGREVRIVVHPRSVFSPEEIVRRARSRLGPCRGPPRASRSPIAG